MVRVVKSGRYARFYVYDTLLERLPQDLEDMAAARGPYVQAAHPVVGQRHLARQQHVAAADQPHIGDGVMPGATRPGCDQCRSSPVRSATLWMRVNGFGQGQRR